MQINMQIFAHLIKERALGTRVLFFLYVLHNLRTDGNLDYLPYTGRTEKPK